MVNYIDRMADALVDVLKYSDSNVEWPEMDGLPADPDIQAEWFYPALQSSDASEIIAILLYTQQAALYDEEMGDVVLGIGLVEMKHFAHIRDIVFIQHGVLPQPLNDEKLHLGDTVEEALAINVKAEFDTIMYYRSVKAKITSTTETAKAIVKTLEKLIADETLHLKMFIELANKYEASEMIKDSMALIHKYSVL